MLSADVEDVVALGFPLCKSTVPRDCKSLKNSAAGLSSQQYYQLEFQTHQYRCHNRLREPQMQRGGQCSGGAGIIDDGVLSSATLLAVLTMIELNMGGFEGVVNEIVINSGRTYPLMVEYVHRLPVVAYRQGLQRDALVSGLPLECVAYNTSLAVVSMTEAPMKFPESPRMASAMFYREDGSIDPTKVLDEGSPKGPPLHIRAGGHSGLGMDGAWCANSERRTRPTASSDRVVLD
ncbi:hypothetical protein EDD16DRAFT_1526144 [Pisolithus croceorrhizus]|nr:hypothetical protein EDD16DRAFT_1526144 [Pisolithus croceorrhizus]KAI6130575.1 hypothetical protein EV401DRAFT_2125642 [Pisolithus croceorrhizus]KAI6161819.1 hypothetical protein EDD17DRAFT_1508688 [Pisolithus thermaeus]